MKTTLRRIGNSLGVTLPKHLIDQLNLKQGDTVNIETKKGKLELKPVDPDFDKWAETYRQANRDYKDVPRELPR